MPDDLDPEALHEGEVIGELPLPGESLPGEMGEARGSAVRAALDQQSDEVDKENLPVERKSLIREYHRLIRETETGAGR